MTGIQFLTDEKGRKVAVQINLKTHGAVWEDFHDGLISESRRKEKASDALEQGKEAAQTQQLKLQLRKLEGEVESASAAFGAEAFDLFEAGSLSASSDLAALATRVRDARAAVEAKKAEIASAGDDDSSES